MTLIAKQQCPDGFHAFMDTEAARKILTDAEKAANNFGLYGFAKREVAHAAIKTAFEAGRADAMAEMEAAGFRQP